MNHFLFNQFRKPSGKFGRLVGWIMSIKNTDRAGWTLEKLNHKPIDHVLEVGYGSGAALQKIAGSLSTGFIAGIDHSDVMFRQASKRNRIYIKNKKAELNLGTIWDLNYPENYFDIIFGSNVHFFWEIPVKEFQLLYALLKPGGRLVMVFQPRWAKSEDHVKQIAEKTKMQFMEAGLSQVEIDFKPMKPVTCIYTGGWKL